MMWGKHKENGIWRNNKRRYRFIWSGHDSLYIAAGKFRMRLMKPHRLRRSFS